MTAQGAAFQSLSATHMDTGDHGGTMNDPIPAAIERLRALAKEATPGNWITMEDGVYEGEIVSATDENIHHVSRDPDGDDRPQDRAFIVGLQPTVALAMLDVVAAAQACDDLLQPDGFMKSTPHHHADGVILWRGHVGRLRTALAAFAAAAGGDHG